MKLIITRKQALYLLKHIPAKASISMIGADAFKIIERKIIKRKK
jgi:hypothetical protein